MSVTYEEGTFMREYTGTRAIWVCDQCGDKVVGAVEEGRQVEPPLKWRFLQSGPNWNPAHLCSWECVGFYSQYQLAKETGVVE